MKRSIIIFMVIMLSLIRIPAAYATTVRIGILPIVDALPFFVAKEKGLFKGLPLPVELIPFRSAVERDAAFQTGKLDAYLGDLISTALLRSRGVPARAVSVILGKKPKEGLFAILSSPDSSIRTLPGLKGKRVAISSNTIIEYVLDGLLKANGISPNAVRKQEIKSIPIRFQMLINNKIDAAVLPDPLASLARYKGAHWIADDGQTNLSQTVLTWNDRFLARHRVFLEKFYAAYNRAVTLINQNHARFRPLLVKKCHLPKPIAKTFHFADFPRAAPPSKKAAARILAWLRWKNLLKKPVTVKDIIVSSTSLRPY